MTTRTPYPAYTQTVVEDATKDRRNLCLSSYPDKNSTNKNMCLIYRTPEAWERWCSHCRGFHGPHDKSYECNEEHRCVTAGGDYFTKLVFENERSLPPTEPSEEELALRTSRRLGCFFCEYDRNARAHDIYSAMKRSLKNASLSDEIRNKLFGMIEKPYPLTSLKESRKRKVKSI